METFAYSKTDVARRRWIATWISAISVNAHQLRIEVAGGSTLTFGYQAGLGVIDCCCRKQDDLVHQTSLPTCTLPDFRPRSRAHVTAVVRFAASDVLRLTTADSDGPNPMDHVFPKYCDH